MTISKPWAAKGVALYPPSFCMVGQNKVFNALHQFRRAFWDGQSHDIAGFFVAFGDWGLGKTRLGYEIIAEATGQMDEWLPNPNEHIIAPYHRSETKSRVLEPALKDGILPLYIRYSTVCDEDLDASTWVSRLTIDAIKQLLKASPKAGGTTELYADLKSVLHAKGLRLDDLKCVHDTSRSIDERLESVRKSLADIGINHIWIIVDEVETVTDLKKGFREEDSPKRIDEEYLLMVSEVIKNENWRKQYPYVNFLLLCSMGMRDQIQIGPNLRRASSVTLEPNQVTDIKSYIGHIKESLKDPDVVNYPHGTIEGAFLGVNRNFGWLNVIMASVHESYVRHLERGETIESWQLLRDFAKTDARSSHIFNDQAALPLIGKVEGVTQNTVERLVYGQLPIEVGGTSSESLSPAMADSLLQHEIPGRGPAFAQLVQVHIDARGLANELTKPEFGFKAKEGDTQTYFSTTTEISVVGLIEALRAFSVSVGNTGGDSEDFVVYEDLDQWNQQLTALYPKEGIEFAAEALHRIFNKPEYHVEDTRYIGMAFRLWREFNKLLVSGADTLRFFKDATHEKSLDTYVTDVSQSKVKKGAAVCLGLAKVLDEHLVDDNVKQHSALKDIPHKAFSSEYRTPPINDLRVTPDGRCTIVYCLDPDDTLTRLKAFMGIERVQPIIVIFPAAADVTEFENQLKATPTLKRCIITKRLIAQEEDFLLNYGGRGLVFNPQTARLSRMANGLLKTYQEDWQAKTREWANTLRKTGYILAPIWSTNRGINVSDFAKGYRHMLAKSCSLDASLEDYGGPLNTVEFENCRQAAKKNINPPAAWKYGDLLGVLTTDESNMPRVPRCFFSLVQELKTQSSINKITNKFFFSVPDTEVKAAKQLEQILEVLLGIGVVKKTGDLYRSVSQILLEDRRQSATTWLKNESKNIITNLQDTFSSQSAILLKADYPEASVRLDEAEKRLKKVDFSLLSAMDIASLSDKHFQTLVKDIAEIENFITKICPLDIGESGLKPFECSTAQIEWYENRFNALSLWEKVSFLSWLKNKFIIERDDLIQEIDDLLTVAVPLELAEGKPFPIAPLTLPIKAIKNELQNTVKGAEGGSKTLMATIKVDNFTLLIDQYLVGSKYNSAWKRLEALHALILRESEKSFYARFHKQYKDWEGVVKDYKKAHTVWDELSAFLSDAPNTITNQINTIKNKIKKYSALVEGGLKKQIQSQTEELNEADLIDSLKTEVSATVPEVKSLEPDMSNIREKILRDLRDIIRKDTLRALNRLLRVKDLPAKEEPLPQKTYGNTKLKYESFNGEIANEGEAYLKRECKKATWGLWVDICSGLEDGSYEEEQHPDHLDSINELKKNKARAVKTGADMKVFVLKNQEDLFEISVLEQSAELISVSIDEFLKEENIRPIVVVGKYLSSDHKSNMQKLTDRIYRTGNSLLLAPPFGDVNIGQYLNAPVAIHAIRRQTQNTCRLIDKQWSSQIAETTKIRSDHHIETSLTAGVTCLDDNEKPVLIRYQPSNTKGAVFISGLQLLSYSAVSDEGDRLKLIELIIDWRPMHLKEDTNTIEHQDFAPTINKSDLVNTILALAAANNPNIDTLKEIAIKYLGINISNDRLSKILSYLQSERIIVWDALSQKFMVSKDQLSQMIEDFGVHAYARELSELFRENTEDWI